MWHRVKLCVRPGLTEPAAGQSERPGIFWNAVQEAVLVSWFYDPVCDREQPFPRVGDGMAGSILRAAGVQRLGVGKPDERAAQHAAAAHGGAARRGIVGGGERLAVAAC